ncbi:MAG: hypothetical protein KC619_09470 [Myxococcales bacterium]|nr:hypothetical protein [Myxococcales bacterium]
MFDQLISAFTQSQQGQTAMQRLQSQGYSPQQAQGFLGAAVPAAAQSFHSAQTGGFAGSRPGGPQGLMDVGNSHYVTNFLSGAVSSLVRGQGIMGAAVDGLQGVAGGHVAQVIASRFGLPQRVAGTVGAIVTPLVIDWLWERFHGGSLDLGSLFGGGGAPAGGMMGQGGTVGGGGMGGAGGMMGAASGMMGALMGQAGGGGGSSWGGGGAPSGGATKPVGNAPRVTAMGGVSPTIQGGLGSLFGQLMGGGGNR